MAATLLKKIYYGIVLFLSTLCTFLMAIQHELGWTLFGLLCTGLNIIGYLQAGGNQDES